jgi:hypothetical protein
MGVSTFLVFLLKGACRKSALGVINTKEDDNLEFLKIVYLFCAHSPF